MLYDTLEIGSAFASLICMFVTIVCIVFGTKGSRTPTFVAGCAFYVMFLALAKHNMDMSEHQTYSTLLFAFAFFVLTAEGIYQEAKKQKRKEGREKIAQFKISCSEARKDARVSKAA